MLAAGARPEAGGRVHNVGGGAPVSLDAALEALAGRAVSARRS
jgi:hypothetical protein